MLRKSKKHNLGAIRERTSKEILLEMHKGTSSYSHPLENHTNQLIFFAIGVKN